MKNKSIGCVVAAIVVVILLVALGAFVVFMSFKVQKSHAEERAMEVTREGELRMVEFSAEEGAVHLQQDDIRQISVPEAGDEITRERFAAFMVVDNATDLAKETFRKRASEATVNWLLRTENVSDRNGVLYGQFQLPWQIKSGSRTTGGAVGVEAEFTDESRANLLGLRRGDWVTVQGQLSFKGNSVVLKNARLEAR